MGEINYIDKTKVLNYVTEESIFGLVFKDIKIEENGEKIHSPFRKDTKPNCYFAYVGNSLKFVDFTAKRKNRDCFDVVKEYYKLNNFWETLDFIYKNLIKGKKLTVIQKKRSCKKEVSIFFKKRNFELQDKKFWSKYGITKKQLVDDRVIPVKEVIIQNTLGEKHAKRYAGTVYAYTDFSENKVKIYSPGYDNKFISNCTKNDIGNFRNIDLYGDKLIITKSYKDCRVLLNQNYKNSIWFQSETMFPKEDILRAICFRFKAITILFDNDKAGIENSKRLFEFLKTIKNDVKNITVESDLSKDISDLYNEKGQDFVKKFLKENI